VNPFGTKGIFMFDFGIKIPYIVEIVGLFCSGRQQQTYYWELLNISEGLQKEMVV